MPKITDNNEVKSQAYRGGEEALVLTPDNKLARVPFETLRSDTINYETKAEMDAAGAPANGQMAKVWNDPTGENNGEYGWNGSAWVASGYDMKSLTLGLAGFKSFSMFGDRLIRDYQGKYGERGFYLPRRIYASGNLALGAVTVVNPVDTRIPYETDYCFLPLLLNSTVVIYYDIANNEYKQIYGNFSASVTKNSDWLPLAVYRNDYIQHNVEMFDVSEPGVWSYPLNFEDPMIVDGDTILIPRFTYRYGVNSYYKTCQAESGLFNEFDIPTDGSVDYLIYDYAEQQAGRADIYVAQDDDTTASSGRFRELVAKMDSGFVTSCYPVAYPSQNKSEKWNTPAAYTYNNNAAEVDISDVDLNALGITKGYESDNGTDRYFCGEYWPDNTRLDNQRCFIRFYVIADQSGDFGTPRAYSHLIDDTFELNNATLEREISATVRAYICRFKFRPGQQLRWSVGNELSGTITAGIQIGWGHECFYVSRTDWPGAADIPANAQQVSELNQSLSAIETALATSASPQRNTLVILGSSNGAGFGASTYSGDPTESDGWASPSTSWAGLLEAYLKNEDPTWQVFNRSISGSDATVSVSRFWTDVAPHRPSHVLLCTALGNQGYNVPEFIADLQTLINYCRQIGAQPIVRGAYPKNAMTADQYAKCLAANRACDLLGVPVINHLSVLDDGNGKWYDGTTYAPDGTHLNDAGQVVFFETMDTQIFTKPLTLQQRLLGTGTITAGTTTDQGIRLHPTNGLDTNIHSFTARHKFNTRQADVSAVNLAAFWCLATNSPMLLKTVAGELIVTDSTSATIANTGLTLSANQEYDIWVTLNHIKDEVQVYNGDQLLVTAPIGGETKYVSAVTLAGRYDIKTAPPAGVEFSIIEFWQCPLTISQIQLINKTGIDMQGSMIFSAQLAACTGAQYMPNRVQNGLLPTISGNWS